MTGRIYLDVDGVLNAVTHNVPSWGWADGVKCIVNGFPICYSPELVEALNAAASSPDVEVFWLTTWEYDAPKHLAPVIGLNGEAWPVVGTELHYSKELENGWWKLVALRDHIAEFDGPVLWIDDDIRFDREAREWLGEEGRVVALSPRTELGITRRQAEIVRRFVAEVATAHPAPAATTREVRALSQTDDRAEESKP